MAVAPEQIDQRWTATLELHDLDIDACHSLEELSLQARKGNRYQIEVEVGEPAESLLDAVRRIPGVTGVTGEDRRIIVNAEADVRPEVSRAVVQSNTSLIGIKIQELSLDEIYLRYFHQDQEKVEK